MLCPADSYAWSGKGVSLTYRMPDQAMCTLLTIVCQITLGCLFLPWQDGMLGVEGLRGTERAIIGDCLIRWRGRVCWTKPQMEPSWMTAERARPLSLAPSSPPAAY